MQKLDYRHLRKKLVEEGRFIKTNTFGLTTVFAELTFFSSVIYGHTLVTPWTPSFFILQILLGTSIFRCFVLLHDCGHYSLVSNRRLNILIGTIMSIICVTPLVAWREIHRKHHRWVGIVDKDPTSEGLVKFETSQQHSAIAVAFLRLIWMLRLPFPALVFTVNTIWLYPLQIYKEGKKKESLNAAASFLVILATHFALVLWLGISIYATYFFPALLFSYIWYEMINLTHHAGLYTLHFETQSKPIPISEQEEFCRSAQMPKWLSLIMSYHFTLHTEHHLFPSIPWHHLPAVKVQMENYTIKKYNGVEFPGFQNALRKTDPVDVLLNRLPLSILELQKGND